jgi:hypothetical protein
LRESGACFKPAESRAEPPLILRLPFKSVNWARLDQQHYEKLEPGQREEIAWHHQ